MTPSILKNDRKKVRLLSITSAPIFVSSFPLARKAEVLDSDIEPTDYEGDFAKDQAVFREEQDVRRSIFDEMSKRSSSFIKDKEDKIVVIPGAWSNFDIDFSRASIFYPLMTSRSRKAISRTQSSTLVYH